MRFFASAGPRPRAPVRLFLASSAVLLLAQLSQRFLEGELTPAGVVSRYLGSGDPAEVMPLTALVEALHGGAFLHGFLLLMVGSLLVTADVADRLRVALTVGAASCCVLDLLAPFAVVYGHWGAALRVGAFLLAFGLLLGGLVVIAVAPERRGS